MLLIRGIQ
jgi:hypothetical protein